MSTAEQPQAEASLQNQITLVSLLVGSHFRPPAKQVLARLPSFTSLRLEPEYDNPYDENAIKVFVSTQAIPEQEYEELERELQGTGYDVDTVCQMEDIWLGYIAATGGKPLAGTKYVGNKEFKELYWDSRAELRFDGQGRALVALIAYPEPEYSI